MVDIMDLSEYIIYYSNTKNYGISCLKLQKILYLLQAEWLITRACKIEENSCVLLLCQEKKKTQ